MNTSETLQNFEDIIHHYIEELNDINLEQLKQQPGDNEWSLGQMYRHLINTALYMQLRSAEQCIAPEGGQSFTDGDKTEAGIAVFELGAFPPIRIQVPPSPQYTPEQPDSKEQLVQGLNTVLQRWKDIAPRIQDAPMQNLVAHPRLGALNAKEWFMLVEMHYRHHLLQKERLKSYLV